jgi:hypothetical protein
VALKFELRASHFIHSTSPSFSFSSLKLDSGVESYSLGERRVHRSTEKAGCQWLMPVILATQEAEVRRITV